MRNLEAIDFVVLLIPLPHPSSHPCVDDLDLDDDYRSEMHVIPFTKTVFTEAAVGIYEKISRYCSLFTVGK